MATKSFCFFRSIPTPSHLAVLGIDDPKVEYVIMTSEELADLPPISLCTLSSLVGVNSAYDPTITAGEEAQLPSGFSHTFIRIAPRDIRYYVIDSKQWWPNTTYDDGRLNWLTVSYSVIPGDAPELNPKQFLAHLGQQTLDAVDAARTWYNMTSARYSRYQSDDNMLNRLESIANFFGATDSASLASKSNAPFLTGPHGVLFPMSWEDFSTYRNAVDEKVRIETERATTERTAAKAARHAFIARLLTHIGDDEMRERHARGLLPQRDLIGAALLPAAFEPRLVYEFASDTGRPTTLSAEEYRVFTDAERMLRNVCGLIHITEVTPVIVTAERCDEIYARITMRDATSDSDWNRTVFLYLTCRCDD